MKEMREMQSDDNRKGKKRKSTDLDDEGDLNNMSESLVKTENVSNVSSKKR